MRRSVWKPVPATPPDNFPRSAYAASKAGQASKLCLRRQMGLLFQVLARVAAAGVKFSGAEMMQRIDLYRRRTASVR